MSELSGLSGFWTGFLIYDPHEPGPTPVRVNVHTEVKNGTITGTYEPSWKHEKARHRGTFTARVNGHEIDVTLSESGPYPGLNFKLHLVEGEGPSMLHGILPVTGARAPFATATVFRSESPAEELKGAWPM